MCLTPLDAWPDPNDLFGVVSDVPVPQYRHSDQFKTSWVKPESKSQVHTVGYQNL